MDNNDSNIKPQQTGGLKLMTVFIAVLALHVVVIGGYSAYMLMSGGSTDADLAATDKTHKDLKSADGSALADGATADASQGDKSASGAQTATPPAEVATIPQAASGPANPPTPAPDQAATTVTPAPAPTSVLAPAPLAPPTSTEVVDQGTPTGPLASELAPPPEPVLVPMTPAPAPSAAPVAGPVHMPPATASAPVHEHEQIYTVKITDSYKKIAHAHHITVAQLKEANHINGDVLHTGQKLMIPSVKTLVAESPAIPAPALDSAPSGPVLDESAPAPTASLASAPSTVASPALHHRLYTVVKGDTLIKIAHKFKTTPTALMTENSITDPTKLAIGKKLRIPSEESRSARNSAPASTPPGQVQAKENAPSAQLANFVP
jgi:LysM repeat protein